MNLDTFLSSSSALATERVGYVFHLNGMKDKTLTDDDNAGWKTVKNGVW